MAPPPAPGCLVIKNALVLPSAHEPPQPHTDLVIEAGMVTALGTNLPHPTHYPVVDGSHYILTPGLINGHFHSHEHFHKGRFDNLPLELWMHFVRPPVPMTDLTPDQVYLRTLIGAMEALHTGTTFVVDDVNQAPQLSMDCIEAVFRAYDDIGLRALVSVSLYDLPFYRAVPFFDQEMPAHHRQALDRQPAPDRDRLLAIAHHLAKTRHPHHHRVGYVVAPSAPQRCTPALLEDLAALADTYDLPMIMHLLETRLQAVTGQLFYQRSMVDYLQDLGVLSQRLALQHCVWLTPQDIEQLAQSGASAVYNPLSNLKLGSGRMAVRALTEAGINLALASDGCGSRDSVNMLSVVQAAALLNKSPHTPPETWVSAAEAFHWGTVGGAQAFGQGRTLGRLGVGYRADLVGYRRDRLAFVPLNQPLNQLVYAETGQAVDLVVVDGAVVLEQGRLTTLDEQAMIANIVDLHQQLLPALERSEASVSQLLPYYRRIYNRCLQQATDPAMLGKG
ncbi:MAG: amidohydrolase [Leptolyngbya sp. LCM1.Bin17]|nr:MAG: amidohydrolase [Leptolyngbya sp. LCM1.Bin17]